jgi:hypothetical protein
MCSGSSVSIPVRYVALHEGVELYTDFKDLGIRRVELGEGEEGEYLPLLRNFSDVRRLADSIIPMSMPLEHNLPSTGHCFAGWIVPGSEAALC